MSTEPLKRVAEVRVSNVDKKSVDGQRPVRLCNYTDVYYNEHITGSLGFMDATATPDQWAAFRLVDGDVLLTKDSETADDIGVSAVVTEALPDLVCGYHVAVIRPRSGRAIGGFLRWALASTAAREMMAASATGVTRFGLRSEAICDLPIPVLTLAVQQAIADYLDRETARIDALILAKRQTVELLQERWHGIMHAAVAGRLIRHDSRRATGVPWLTDVPAHWREGLLKLVARLGSGHTPSRNHPEWWIDPIIPWITTGEVGPLRNDRVEYIHETRESISDVGMLNSAAALHPAGTVVLCRTASAGYSGIMVTDMATSQDFATWTCGPMLRPRFLLLCLRVMRQDLLGRLAMGSTHKTIYMPEIESIKVPLPPGAEQDAIVEAAYSRLSAIDGAMTGLTNQVRLLQEHRQALITAAVTGELDIPGSAA